MYLLLENWREYMKGKEFQPPTQKAVDNDIDQYLKDINLNRDDVDIEEDSIVDKIKIHDLAQQAMALGNITDDMITDIRNDGEIKKPVILNKDTDEIIDGKHRFIAAAEYGLDLPVIYISIKGSR
jgi:hypothetical protein